MRFINYSCNGTVYPIVTLFLLLTSDVGYIYIYIYIYIYMDIDI